MKLTQEFWIRDDRYGDPIIHTPKCTCPSIVDKNGKIGENVWISSGVENLGELARGLGIEPEEIKIAHCVGDDISRDHGWGRRFRKSAAGRSGQNGQISPELGDWVRSLETMARDRIREKPDPVTGPKSGKLAGNGNKNPAQLNGDHIPERIQMHEESHSLVGRPASAHAECSHERTKAARAKCRKLRAK